MACCTVVIFSASSSGISVSNSSSSAITSSTVSSESAPRSSTNEASLVTSSSLTPSCSATIFFTCCSTVLIVMVSSRNCYLCTEPTKARDQPSRNRRARILCEHGDGGYLERTFDIWPVLFVLTNPDVLGPDSRHVHPAIDVQGLAGDVGTVGRAQKRHRRGNVGRLTQPAQGNLAVQGRALLLAQGAGHV